MNHIEGIDRSAAIGRFLEELVSPESFVRIINGFVDSLDLESFGFAYYSLNKEGRPSFHPLVLMKRYLYGYHNGIRSCRKLAHACTNNLEGMWLVEGRQPSFQTVNNFRSMNVDAFGSVFWHFVAILKDWKLIEGKIQTLDSFKIRAENSLKKNFNKHKIKRHLTYIDKKRHEYEQALAEQTPLDKEEEKLILAKMEDKQRRKHTYQALDKRLNESQEAQISTTDPDSRAVVFQRTSVKVGDNIQAATDAKHKLLVAMDTGDVNYYRQRQSLIEHPFGSLKRQWGFEYSLLKGKEKVLAEVSLNFTCYNFVRIVSILGFDSVLEKLRNLFRHFLHNLIRIPLQRLL